MLFIFCSYSEICHPSFKEMPQTENFTLIAWTRKKKKKENFTLNFSQNSC